MYREEKRKGKKNILNESVAVESVKYGTETLS